MDISPLRNPQAWLRRLFSIAVDAVRPAACLPPALAALPLRSGRILVLGAGKAAAEMARVAEDCYGVERLDGLVITRYGHGAPTRRIEVVEAAHPLPDAAGVAAAGRILRMAQAAGEGGLVLCLLSGGGSALLALPAAGVSLADKQAITRALLASGAPIEEFNCVRKHLSAIKGGRLAAAVWPARLITLAISDVAGDDPSVIASGPTAADPSTRQQALEILRRRAIDPPAPVRRHLAGPESETPKPGDARFARAEYHIIARASDALNAAADAARDAGVIPLIIGADITGEAHEIARIHAELAPRHAAGARPVLLLSGGELTVTHRGKSGAGGRNQEYALALAIRLDGAHGVHALACDTDGIDGQPGDGPAAAGAVIGPDTLPQARAAGLDPQAFLDEHNSYAFFRAIGGLLVTGPSRTNVNDFRAILIAPDESG